MTIWAMEHPWMTFFLIAFAIIGISQAIQAFAHDGRKRNE